MTRHNVTACIARDECHSCGGMLIDRPVTPPKTRHVKTCINADCMQVYPYTKTK